MHSPKAKQIAPSPKYGHRDLVSGVVGGRIFFSVSAIAKTYNFMMWAEQFHPFYGQTSQNIHLIVLGVVNLKNLSVPLNEEERVCVWHPQTAYPDRHQKEEMTLIV